MCRDNDELSRKEIISEIIVFHPRMKTILDKLISCTIASAHTREPQCMIVTGPAGVGKTTLIESLKDNLSSSNDFCKKSIPIVSIEIPEKATIDIITQAFLENLGDPMSYRGGLSEKKSRVIKLLIARNVKVVIIDEFQNVIDKKTQKAVFHISNYIKSLINQTKIPYFLFGMESSIRVLEEDPEDQLRQRFSVRRSLEPFKWDPEGDNSEFITLMSIIDKSLPFDKSSNLNQYDIALKLILASRGRFRYIMKIIQWAGDYSIDNNLSHIPISALSNGFLEQVGTDKLVPINPFDLSHPDLLNMARKVFPKRQSPEAPALSSVFRK